MPVEYTREQVNELVERLTGNGVDSGKIDAVLKEAVGKTLSGYFCNVLRVGPKQATELTTLAGGALNTLLVQSLANVLTEATARL